MTQEEAKKWSRLSVVFEDHIDKIYSDFKIELEAEYKRGWKDRATQSDLENKTCESCKHFEEGICYSNKICLMNGGEHILTTKEFSCNQWEQNRYVKREGLK